MSDETVVSDDEVVVDPLPPPPPPLPRMDDVGRRRHHAARRPRVDRRRGDPRRRRRPPRRATSRSPACSSPSPSPSSVSACSPSCKGGRLAAVADRSRQPRRRRGLGSDAAVGHQLDRRPGGRRGPAVHRHRLRHARCDRRRRRPRRPRPRPHDGVDACASGCRRSPSASSRWRRCSSAPTTRTATARRPSPRRRRAPPTATRTAATTTPRLPRPPLPSVDWPRPCDPAAPIDFCGVDGVTPEQQLRATALVRHTLEELPPFADVDTLDDARLPVDRRRRAPATSTTSTTR